MGNCIYCGGKAGFFSKYHPDCKAKYDEGMNLMISKIKDSVIADTNLESLNDQLKSIAIASRIPIDKIRLILVEGWEKAFETFTKDKLLTLDDEHKLMDFVNQFSLTQDELNIRNVYNRVAMNATLREVMEGKLHSHMQIEIQLPYILEKSEKIIWLFQNGVNYYEEKIQRSRVGSYSGISVRVAKGVYTHFGESRGQSIETPMMVLQDTGQFAITNKNIYFHGQRKSFRIPYKKIVSFTPYSDGIEVFKDTASAKPQIFLTGEGWFVYNLVTNLATLQIEA